VDGQVSIPDRGKTFLISTASRPSLGYIQPPIQWVLGAISVCPNRLEYESDLSSPFGAEFKTTWSYTSIPNTFTWRDTELSKRQSMLSFLLILICFSRKETDMSVFSSLLVTKT
jgi:hypothetical protein